MSDTSQFEELFKSTFPDIYRLHVLGKPLEEGGGGEAHIWALVDTLLSMNTEQDSGRIEVFITRGRINQIKKVQEILNNKASRPGY